MADDGEITQSVDPLTSYGALVSDNPAQQKLEEAAPLYRVIGESKIPVSKHRGALWKSRLDQADSAMEKDRKAWREAIRYYHNDHTREGTGIESGSNSSDTGPLGSTAQRETENLVFANVSALVPMLYTKNPDAEFTAQSEETKPLSELLEKLMKKLAAQKAAPGLNLKRKVKRNIVMTTLTNCAWFEVGYTMRDQSSDQALQELQTLSQEFQEAKDQKTIKEIEGKLLALESKVDLLSPPGPWVKTRRPWEVRVDPSATELDLSDANWVICEDMMMTSLLQAQYGKKNEAGEWESVYEPTHILKNGTSPEGTNLTGDNFVLFSKDGADKAGYKDDAAYLAAQMTKVFYVWDRATRRCELYSDASWKFPVWVWDDPYHLDQFFPYVPMEFHTDPMRMHAKGEVTYYLDHQDAINGMNNEFARIRAHASSLVGYNKNILTDPAEVESFISGTYNKRAMGFNLPEGMKISDVMMPVLPPSAEVLKLFDKTQALQSIDRVSGVTAVQRGVEYKTNTTNRAIESYESQQQTRADEKMDAIEESVGTVLWLVAQMCLQFMQPQDIADLLGAEDAQAWQTFDPKDIPLKFSPRVVGGSTLKPSSRAKKEQALQIAQVVGQFAKATPAAVIVAVKVLESAFNNEMVINDKDWTMILEGIQAQMQQGQAQPAPQGASAAPPDGSQPQEGAPPEQAGAVGDVVKKTILGAMQLLDQMPPEMREQIGVMLARQMPMQEIASEIMSKLQQPQ